MKKEKVNRESILHLQISFNVLVDCLKVVMSRLELYNSERLVCTSRQRLTWKLSALTLRNLRPIEKFKGNSLAPISELAINEFQISEQ